MSRSNVFLLLSVIVAITMQSANAGHPEKGRAKYEALVQDCLVKEGATESDRAEMLARLVPTTVTSNCLYTCVLERIGVIRDGKLSADGVEAVSLSRTGGNLEKAANARAVAEICADVHVGVEHRCELAMKIVDCTSKAAAARGNDPHGILD